MSTSPRRSERRRLAAMVSVRFTPAEEERVRVAAAEAGASMSNFIREAALGACDVAEAPIVTLSWARPRVVGGLTTSVGASVTLAAI